MDLIERQAAIDAVSDLYWMDERLLNFKKEIDATFDKIMALPSAQPEPCVDAMSRQYILDVLAEYIEEYREVDEKGNHDPKWCAMKEAEMVVKEAPYVKPEIIHCRECAKLQFDRLSHAFWCDGRSVTPDHYCGYARRRTDEGSGK